MSHHPPHPRPSRPAGRRGRAVARVALAAAALAASASVAITTTSSPAGAYPGEAVFTATGSFTVPAGVRSATFEVVGGRGGNAGTGGVTSGGGGGLGRRIVVTGAVTEGEVFAIGIGGRGGNGANNKDDYGGGGGGYTAGGAGNTGSLAGRASGGGGGGTNVTLAGAPMIVAGGGGGGGGNGAFGNGGNGGGGDQPGAAGTGEGAGGGGRNYLGIGSTGGRGDNAGTGSSGGGGGGGGGGYQGGAGSISGEVGGGGGGGGSGSGGQSFVETSRFVGATYDYSGSTYDGYVKVTYNRTYATVTSVTTTTPELTAGAVGRFAVQVDPTGTTDRPAGTVELFTGSTSLGAPLNLPTSGSLAFDVSGLPVGDLAVRAVFTPAQPDDFAASEGATAVAVAPASASVLVAASSSPSATGQAVTFTAAVAGVAPATALPTGTVELFDGTTSLGAPIPLDGSGRAATSTSALAVGSHPITARYAGDARYAAATSPVLDHRVNPGDIAVALVSSQNPGVTGQAVTFGATVSVVGAATGTPTGTVAFEVAGAPIGEPIPLSAAGQAELTTSDLSVGSHQVSARYQGDQAFGAASSTTRTQVVNPGDVTVTLADPGPTTTGRTASFTVAIAAVTPAAGTPTGSVQLLVGGSPIGEPVDLDADAQTAGARATGTVTLATDALPTGSNRVTARYLGDERFSAALSNPLDHVVNPGDTKSELVASATQVEEGEAVTFTATVTKVGDAVGVPTGTVTFFGDGAPLGSPVPIDGRGRAVLETDRLPVGSHVITGEYSGDGDFSAAGTRTLSLVVTADPAKPGTASGPGGTVGLTYPGGSGRDGQASGSLPRTGADAAGLVGRALLLVLVGAAVLGTRTVVVRRRALGLRAP